MAITPRGDSYRVSLSHKGKRYQPSYVGRLVHADIVGPFKRTLIHRRIHRCVCVSVV